MPELVLILFKINLVLLLFAAAYYLVLRRLTFYTINRIFLVGGIIFSTIYPFINLTDFFHRQQEINPRVTAFVPTIDVNRLIETNSIIDYWQIAVLFFYAGVLFMSLRLILQFVSLYRVHKNSIPGDVDGLPVRILNGQLSPFSFWQTVYVNPAIHSENELDTILAHEQIHVKEWHTLDIILAEISVVFYWFNPGVWLMKRAIKENIEFITDARIVKRGMDKKAYQYSLLGVGSLQASVTLVNNFNLSDLKKRIKMMNAKRSSPKKLLIYAFILPVLLITTLAFTVSKKEVKRHLIPLTQALTEVTGFEKSAGKTETTVLKVKTKVKARITNMKPDVILKDTISRVHLVMKAVHLIGDSTTMGGHIPEEVLARIARLKDQFQGKVKGIKLENATFFYSYQDTLLQIEKLDKTATVTVVGRRKDDGVPNSNTTLVLRGVNLAKDVDSLQKVKMSYRVNGQPITADQLNKIDPNNLKSVAVKRLEKDIAELIITAKTPTNQ